MKCAPHLYSLHNYWFCYEKGKKKNYPQLFLEEFKNRIKEIKMSEFIDAKLDSDSSSDSE